MSQLTASQNYSCPACGGEAQWNAAKGALVCAFCGTVSPASMPEAGGAIVENDLATALRNLGEDQRGWDTATQSVKCQNCQAITVFDASHVSQRCDFCGSTALVPYEQSNAPIRPESLLEFKIPESQVREQIRQWYGSHFWAPNSLKTQALTDTLKGVYLPYWTFDAEVAARWTAEAGYHYYVSETYRDSDGKTKSRQVQKTRWEPASGHITHFFDDDLVPASVGVKPKLLRGVEPFPTTQDLKPYSSTFLSGWPVEQYQIDLITAAQSSRESMERQTTDLCSQEVPGDTQRGLQVDPDFSGQTFKHILVPLWLLSYTYGAVSYQVAVNGYTGAIAGDYPISKTKVFWAVVLALIVGVILISVMGNMR